jgi:nitrate reductase assembly molybdenum cofactor insertion protein NarJ
MSTFTDSPFLPAAEKRRVLTEWHRFLQALARRLADRHRCFRAFPDALYNHLIQLKWTRLSRPRNAIS